VNAASRRSQRSAAGLFLLVGIPAGVAIALAGGLLAIMPLLLLVVPIVVLGRPLGVETLDRIREGIGRPRRRPDSSDEPRRSDFDLAVPRTGLLLANSLAERGPPVVALSS